MDWYSVSLNGAREINEDHIKVIEHNDLKCFVAADGLGGHGGGDAASALACKAFGDVFGKAGSADPLAELLSAAFLRAQTAVLDAQKAAGSQFQMKTTVCALAVRGSEAMWGHIGDTRLYAFAHYKVKLRTLDHSVPQMLVLAREIREKDIRNHPDRNKLLRVLGVSGETPRFELSEPQCAKKYQAFLLCSDGFWELIDEKEMGAALKKSSSARDWLGQMSETVMRRGNEVDMDNSSAIAIWV